MLAIKPASQASSSSAPLTPGTSTVWEIPPRPKPGRKPKKDEPESKRKAQNRESQRAFRTRKAEYLTSLEQRVQEFEKQDGEKSVYFQGIAKRFKEENDRLKEENKSLKEQVERLQSQVQAQLSSPVGTSSVQVVQVSGSPAPSPPEATNAAFLLAGLTSTDPAEPEVPTRLQIPSGGCGLCTSPESGDCLCREVLADQPPSPPPSNFVREERPTVVPLKRQRLSNGASVKKVWDIEDHRPRECTGNPKDCSACQGDSFGQQFCTILSDTMCSNKDLRCSTCPSNLNHKSKEVPQAQGGGCCGDPEFCTGTLRLPPCSTFNAPPSDPLLPSNTNASPTRTLMPANLAWEQFKTHPNIEYTDLHMLANVVAAHAHCEVTTIPTPRTPPLGFSKFAQEGFEPPKELVPTDQLKRKRVVVEREGVEEAIRLLDKGAFGRLESDGF
ncbi:hypothetical protein BT69DRAFT_572326 [Atractiella rhizophila]|nr:hypothetical protein BT69DRAFT_572326 [Atractiella rhizophila]